MSNPLAVRLQTAMFAGLIAVVISESRFVGAQPPRGQDVYQDFRGSKPLTEEWKMIGQNREAVIQPEAEGLRIKLGKTPKSTQPVGVRLMFPVSGDFEITAGYQLLAADMPPPNAAGVGVAFNLVAQNDHKQFVRFGRFVFGTEGNVYLWESRIKDEPEKYQMNTVRTTARAGKLRVVREGANLRYLVADDPPDVFREVHRGVFTDEDLEIVRLGVNNNATPAAVDVRIMDIRIRFTAKPGDVVAAPGQDAKPDERPSSRPWLVVALVVGIAVVLIFASAAAFLVVRQRRRSVDAPIPAEAADEAETPGASRPVPLSVTCTGCGKKLKVKPESAGKKIRCSQCGTAVLVPAAR